MHVDSHQTLIFLAACNSQCSEVFFECDVTPPLRLIKEIACTLLAIIRETEVASAISQCTLESTIQVAVHVLLDDRLSSDSLLEGDSKELVKNIVKIINKVGFNVTLTMNGVPVLPCLLTRHTSLACYEGNNDATAGNVTIGSPGTTAIRHLINWDPRTCQSIQSADQTF